MNSIKIENSSIMLEITNNMNILKINDVITYTYSKNDNIGIFIAIVTETDDEFVRIDDICAINDIYTTEQDIKIKNTDISFNFNSVLFNNDSIQGSDNILRKVQDEFPYLFI